MSISTDREELRDALTEEILRHVGEPVEKVISDPLGVSTEIALGIIDNVLSVESVRRRAVWENEVIQQGRETVDQAVRTADALERIANNLEELVLYKRINQ